MEIQLYNVYEDGKLILKDAKPEQIWKYRIERSRIEQDYNEIRVKRRMLEDWEQLIAPFKKVIWVTMVDRDTRVLRIKS